MASPPTRDPITCHVLDQTTGLPAPSLHVTLTVGLNLNLHLHPNPDHSSPNPSPLPATLPATFTALTSTTDGRINTWTPASDAPGLEETMRRFRDDAAEGKGAEKREKIVCGLKLDTGAYFGEGATFFPEVEIRFFVDAGVGEERKAHWHVPLLLGPWSYTTYRGS